MVKNNQTPIAALPGGQLHQAVRGGFDGGAQRIGDVDPAMKFTVGLFERVAALAEGRGDASRRGPAERRGSEEFALILDEMGDLRIIRYHDILALLHFRQLALHIFHPQRRTAAAQHP